MGGQTLRGRAPKQSLNNRPPSNKLNLRELHVDFSSYHFHWSCLSAVRKCEAAPEQVGDKATRRSVRELSFSEVHFVP
jgi:hypothetical protein